MSIMDSIVLAKRKLFRRLNYAGLFYVNKNERLPIVIIAGYTRSGTTFLGRIISNVLACRPIHEPLNPGKVSETVFFNERESIAKICGDEKYDNALRKVFGPHFKGSRYTNSGTRMVYRGRLIKIVRANHYLDYLSQMERDQKFIFIMRNPWACVASRLRLNWPVPDLANFINDVIDLLNEEQRECIEKTESKAGKMAISWCIDNYMALRNKDNPAFYFIHYEQLVIYPESSMKNLLMHIKQDYESSDLEKEIRLEGVGKNAAPRLEAWRKHMNQDEMNEVESVLSIFNMNDFYSKEDTLPLGKLPFTVTGAR